MQATRPVPVSGQPARPTEQLIEGSVEANQRRPQAEGGHQRETWYSRTDEEVKARPAEQLSHLRI